MRKWIFGLGVTSGIMFCFDAALASTEFVGEFSQVSSTGSPCDSIFREREYRGAHRLAGPTRRTSVFHFQREGEENGFFDGLTLVGLYGPDGDVYYEKNLARPEGHYDLLFEGYVTPQFVLMQVEVVLLSSEQGEELCRAVAEFSAFQ